MKQNKILLLGGNGLLGTELKKHLVGNVYSPTKIKLNISNSEDFPVLGYSDLTHIINLAAIKEEKDVIADPWQAIETNIIGAAHCALASMHYNARYIYISTDYVYPDIAGTQNVNHEDSNLYPQNEYAWTKLAGEASARLVKNHAIIRTSFFPNEFPYKKAYSFKWSSKDYVDIIAPKIAKVILSEFVGTINVGSERHSIYEIAKERTPDIKEDPLITHNLPIDTSMNTRLYNKLFGEKN
jgi:dTDP-4-dehydrorhamnose reductase